MARRDGLASISDCASAGGVDIARSGCDARAVGWFRVLMLTGGGVLVFFLRMISGIKGLGIDAGDCGIEESCGPKLERVGEGDAQFLMLQLRSTCDVKLFALPVGEGNKPCSLPSSVIALASVPYLLLLRLLLLAA